MEYRYLIIFGFIWLLGLTIFLGRIFFYFRNFLGKSDKGTLERLLDKVLSQEEKNSISIDRINRQIQELKKEGELHIQKIGLVRFNPFREMGGEHSFSLALLDGKGTGIIITSLHGRERTRVYLKNIKEGKSLLDLSEEEERALRIAQKLNK